MWFESFTLLVSAVLAYALFRIFYILLKPRYEPYPFIWTNNSTATLDWFTTSNASSTFTNFYNCNFGGTSQLDQ